MSFLFTNCDEIKKKAYEEGFNDGLSNKIGRYEWNIERLRSDYQELAKATENIKISTPDALRDRLESILKDITGENAHWSLSNIHLRKQERLTIFEGHIQQLVLDLQRPIYNILRAYYVTGKASIDPTTLETLKGMIAPELQAKLDNEMKLHTERLNAIKRARDVAAEEQRIAEEEERNRDREVSHAEMMAWYRNNPHLLQVTRNDNGKRNRRPSLDNTTLQTVITIPPTSTTALVTSTTAPVTTTSTTATTLSSTVSSTTTRPSLAQPFARHGLPPGFRFNSKPPSASNNRSNTEL